MADSGNPEDLVSQVSILGTEESAAKLNAYADAGSKSFEKLNASAQVASKGVEASAARIEASGKVAASGLGNVEESGSRLALIPGHIKNIENAVSKLTSRLPQLTQAIGRFSQRLVLVGTAAGAAVTGLAAVAAKVAKASDTQTSALEEQTKAQIASNNSSLQGQVAGINLEASQRKLLQQVYDGKITYAQYSEQLKQLNKDYKEQEKVAQEVENAQERVRLENERLTKQAADTKAFQAQIDMFGGPLLTSLIQLGRQSQTLFGQMKQTFGPVIAKGIDLISSALSTNGQAISKFFDTAAAKLNTLLTNSGPQLQLLFENLAKAASAIFLGIIDAAPGVIDFFNNVLVPAISKIGSALSGLATVINKIFGTQLTGGSIALILVLAQMTGSIRLLFAVLRLGGSVSKGFITVIEQIGIAIAEVFGLKATSKVIALGAASVKSGGLFKTFLAIIRTAIPLVSMLGAALGVGFGPALIIVVAIGAALIYILKNVDWKKFGAAAAATFKDIVDWFKKTIENAKVVGQRIRDAWNGVGEFFTSLGAKISGAISGAWQGVKDLASSAAQLVVDRWNTVVAWFAAFPGNLATVFNFVWGNAKDLAQQAAQWVIDKWNAVVAWFAAFPGNLVAVFTALWTTVSDGVAGAAQWVIDKWNAVVDFFKDIGSKISQFFVDLWQQVTDTFNAAIERIKGFFSGLLADAKAKLQPIIDLLKGIAALASSVSGGDDTASVQAAGGGHIRGPGTSTSDSIPAWLSDNEYVMRAKAVAKYGLGFMRAVNTGTFKMPRFNLGGLVSGMIGPTPRFAYADGGPVQSTATMRPINLSLFGEAFDGLLAPEDVGERLTKFAVARQTRSAGRKPAWLGRGRN